jgi:hypothetical protein
MLPPAIRTGEAPRFASLVRPIIQDIIWSDDGQSKFFRFSHPKILRAGRPSIDCNNQCDASALLMKALEEHQQQAMRRGVSFLSYPA